MSFKEQILDSATEDVQGYESIPDNFLQHIEQFIEHPALYTMILQLTKKQRKILSEHYLFQKSLTTIADEWGESPQNISNLKRGALRYLQQQWSKYSKE